MVVKERYLGYTTPTVGAPNRVNMASPMLVTASTSPLHRLHINARKILLNTSNKHDECYQTYFAHQGTTEKPPSNIAPRRENLGFSNIIELTNPNGSQTEKASLNTSIGSNSAKPQQENQQVNQGARHFEAPETLESIRKEAGIITSREQSVTDTMRHSDSHQDLKP